MGMEQGGTSEQTTISYEPDVYKRFSQPGVKYLLPLDPSHPQIALQEPRSFMQDTNLMNTEHMQTKAIPVYTVPIITDPTNERSSNLLEYITTSVHNLSETNHAFRQVEEILTNENNFAYRAAKVTADELADNAEEPQLNKLISIATYGVDYPPHNAGRNFANVSISINDLFSAVHYLQNYDRHNFPEMRSLYSLLLIYKAQGLDYVEDTPYKDIHGRKSPQHYGVKITDNETLRDKLQAVILVPFAKVEQEEK